MGRVVGKALTFGFKNGGNRLAFKGVTGKYQVVVETGAETIFL
jgi:hypothetical protein